MKVQNNAKTQQSMKIQERHATELCQELVIKYKDEI